jgi:hypothetical protein
MLWIGCTHKTRKHENELWPNSDSLPQAVVSAAEDRLANDTAASEEQANERAVIDKTIGNKAADVEACGTARSLLCNEIFQYP